ncbi:GDH2 [Candida oxycetoniae]|uniref:GDH2 n=1 Tax=Candida oxycetoniae TaxID=497107 RepID=A0AAI9WX77_9ASCO|nr:GDH2 [Candida oxycetoniae]KAI3403714.2 GDH2 [Candida oxycetoniae]
MSAVGLENGVSKLAINQDRDSNETGQSLPFSLNQDYIDNPFSGKKDQFDQVLDVLDSTGFIPEPLLESEAKWFYESLGIDDVFFARSSPEEIAGHIHALYACKVQAFANSGEQPLISYKREAEDHAVFFDTIDAHVYQRNVFEERIDDKYIDPFDGSAKSYRLEYFCSPLKYETDPILNGVYSQNKNLGEQYVRLFFVYKNHFNPLNGKVSKEETDINKIGDTTFLKIASPHTKSLYESINKEVITSAGPIIKHFPIDQSEEYRVIIGYRQHSAPRYNSGLSDLANYYKLQTTRKYIEQFANGVTIISMYVTSKSRKSSVDLSIYQVIKEASLLYCIPHNFFHDRLIQGDLSLQESIYAQSGVIFVTHFLNRLGPEYTKLSSLLDPSKSTEHAEVLNSLKKRLRAETYTQEYIKEVFNVRSEIVRKLYRQFADVHYIRSSMEKTLSYQRLSQISPVGSEEEFENLLSRECSQNEHHAIVLRALYTFNKAILKTNFYTPTKVALSFRLDPSFLPEAEYPERPYGMFFVVGSEFRGFHIRFRDIARGGIRIVRSRSLDAYNVNARNLFDENYNLANTQQRKNKDIPEGGSKGVILLDAGSAQDRSQASFEKYIDALIDLLLKQHIPGVKDNYVDLYNKPEILFLGPDEGTAGYVNWATLHARARGAPWWKSFLTGKSPQLGGIPHDKYSMTTLSVRAYVNKIYEKLNIDDSTIRKFQTGGPDGDLGSNEILLSRNENYVGIVDGSGVICDPTGLDKGELIRLAKERKMIEHYDRSKLSPNGYIVLVDDMDVTLPNGQVVTSGVAFRNTFHLKLKKQYGVNGVDLFVPCGGRPAAIDTNNVHELIDDKTGKSVVPYFVEGANLFITQSAKLILEKAGIIIFKDASTNKGGVTSSSLEVLAALAFDDKGFLENMCVNSETGTKPEFYEKFVKDVQNKIVLNANAEFEALWRLHQDTGIPFTILSDKLSLAINKLGDELANSKELWEDDVDFRNAVLLDSLPPLLLEKIGIENVLARVPKAYLKAIFATHLASSFVYSRGIDSNPAKFLEFISNLRKQFIKRGLLKFHPEDSSKIYIGTYKLEDNGRKHGSLDYYHYDPSEQRLVLVQAIMTEAAILDMKFNPNDTSILVSAHSNGHIMLWTVSSGEGPILIKDIAVDEDTLITSIFFSPVHQNLMLLTLTNGSSAVFDLENCTPTLLETQHSLECWTGSFGGLGHLQDVVYTGGDDSQLIAHDLRMATAIWTLKKGHDAGVVSILSPTTRWNSSKSNLLWTGSYDDHLRVWDLRCISSSNPNLLPNRMPINLYKENLNGGVWRLIPSPNDSRILSCCMYDGARIIDASDVNFQVQRYFKGDHESMCYGGDWSSDGKVVATCSFYDNVVQIWSPNET